MSVVVYDRAMTSKWATKGGVHSVLGRPIPGLIPTETWHWTLNGNGPLLSQLTMAQAYGEIVHVGHYQVEE
jgi:hypothetical protein